MALCLSKVGKLPVLDVRGQRAQAELWEDWVDEIICWFEGYFRIKDDIVLDHFIALMCEGRPKVEAALLKAMMKVAGEAGPKHKGSGE